MQGNTPPMKAQLSVEGAYQVNDPVVVAMSQTLKQHPHDGLYFGGRQGTGLVKFQTMRQHAIQVGLAEFKRKQQLAARPRRNIDKLYKHVYKSAIKSRQLRRPLVRNRAMPKGNGRTRTTFG